MNPRLFYFILLFLFSFCQAEENIHQDKGESQILFDIGRHHLNKRIDQRSGFIDNNGIKIYYQDYGKKHQPTLVFIHAYPYSSRIFRCQFNNLSKSFRVVALDLHGYGRSGPSLSLDYSIPSFASDVRAVIEGLGIQQPILIGESLGSVVAQYYAATYQDISKLILLSPYVHISSLLYGLDPIAIAALRAGILADRKTTIKELIVSTTPETCSEIKKIRRFLFSISTKALTEALVQTIDQSFPFNAADLLPLIQVPTLIVFGNQDPIMNRQGVYFLRDHILNSRLVEFPGGHVFNITQSKDLNRLISDFIEHRESHCPTCF